MNPILVPKFLAKKTEPPKSTDMKKRILHTTDKYKCLNKPLKLKQQNFQRHSLYWSKSCCTEKFCTTSSQSSPYKMLFTT